MEIILALDFDGTLYRLEEHDSEEMLMAVAAVSDEEKALMDETIRNLRAGENPRVFEEVLRDMLIGKPLDLIRKAVDKIIPLTDMNEMETVKRIVRRPNVHLHIVSCGTDMLVAEFLDRVGLLEYTEGIHAKELLHDDETFINFVWHITGPDDKRTAVLNLKRENPGCRLISVGDGFTDGPMLSASDTGLLIELPGRAHHDMPFDRIKSYSELISILDKQH